MSRVLSRLKTRRGTDYAYFIDPSLITCLPFYLLPPFLPSLPSCLTFEVHQNTCLLFTSCPPSLRPFIPAFLPAFQEAKRGEAAAVAERDRALKALEDAAVDHETQMAAR
ncbi:unnamed protein product [Closterium sp. NIES-53]